MKAAGTDSAGGAEKSTMSTNASTTLNAGGSTVLNSANGNSSGGAASGGGPPPGGMNSSNIVNINSNKPAGAINMTPKKTKLQNKQLKDKLQRLHYEIETMTRKLELARRRSSRLEDEIKMALKERREVLQRGAPGAAGETEEQAAGTAPGANDINTMEVSRSA